MWICSTEAGYSRGNRDQPRISAVAQQITFADYTPITLTLSALQCERANAAAAAPSSLAGLDFGRPSLMRLAGASHPPISSRRHTTAQAWWCTHAQCTATQACAGPMVHRRSLPLGCRTRRGHAPHSIICNVGHSVATRPHRAEMHRGTPQHSPRNARTVHRRTVIGVEKPCWVSHAALPRATKQNLRSGTAWQCAFRAQIRRRQSLWRPAAQPRTRTHSAHVHAPTCA